VIQTLAPEAETAISQMNSNDQNYMKHLIAKNIKNLKNNIIHNTTKTTKRKLLKKNKK
jgi:hypothetical protein